MFVSLPVGLANSAYVFRRFRYVTGATQQSSVSYLWLATQGIWQDMVYLTAASLKNRSASFATAGRSLDDGATSGTIEL
jgi:hypothetical protein